MKTKTASTNKGTSAKPARAARNPAARCKSNTHGTNAPVSSALRSKSIRVPIVFSAPEQFEAKLTLLHVLEPAPMPDFVKAYRHVSANDKRMPGKAQIELFAKQGAMNPQIVKRTLVGQTRSFCGITNAARTVKADLTDLIIRAREHDFV